MITWENYEEYMMMHADGELQPAEEQELMAFIDEHPQLRQEMADYQRSILSPDLSQAYAGKQSLLKPIAQKRTIAFPLWRRYSIAAGIAAIIFISLFRLRETDNYMAKTNITRPVGTHNTAPLAATRSTGIKSSSATQPSTDSTSHKQTIATQFAHITRSTFNNAAHVTNHKQEQQQQQEPVIARRQIASAASFAAIEVKPLTLHKNEESIAAIAVPELLPDAEAPVKRSFWDKLPISETNKKDAKNIAHAITNTYERINDLKEKISDKSVTITIEKRKLILSF